MSNDQEPTPVCDPELEAYINRCLTYHPPKPERRNDFDQLRTVAQIFATTVFTVCPAGRERALALTALEDAVSRANAAIARDGY